MQPAVRETGAQMVALCPQRPEYLRKMRDKHHLEFDILRDEGNAYGASLGLRFTLPEYLQAIYLRFGIDLPRVNGEPPWTLSIPARYVVRRDGTIAAADVDPDYTSRPEPGKTLDDLRGLS